MKKYVELVVKNPPADGGDIRDTGWIPGSGRSPGRGSGYPLQYSCLENPMDRGAWWATVHGVSKSQTWLKRLSMHTSKCALARRTALAKYHHCKSYFAGPHCNWAQSPLGRLSYIKNLSDFETIQLCVPEGGQDLAHLWVALKKLTGILKRHSGKYSISRAHQGNGNPLQYSCLENPMDGGA